LFLKKSLIPIDQYNLDHDDVLLIENITKLLQVFVDKENKEFEKTLRPRG